jgi:hypothetical protein
MLPAPPLVLGYGTSIRYGLNSRLDLLNPLVKGRFERLADIQDILDYIDLSDCSEEIMEVICENTFS